MRPRRWWPRRAGGLPAGQRLLTVMPRFSDDPRRPPPPIPEPAAVDIDVDGTVTHHSVADLDEAGTERVADFHCVTGWSVRDLRWTGVPLRRLVDPAAVGSYARVEAHDGAVAVFLTADLLDDRTLPATRLGGEPLSARHGAPIRLVTPHQYGYKNVKHVRRIEFLSEQPPSALGPKEHLRARVDREERHARLPNWLIRTPYSLMIPITAWVAERSSADRAEVTPRRRSR